MFENGCDSVPTDLPPPERKTTNKWRLKIVFLCIFFIMTCGTAKQASISKPPVSWMRTIPLVTIDQSESLHLVHIHV